METGKNTYVKIASHCNVHLINLLRANNNNAIKWNMGICLVVKIQILIKTFGNLNDFLPEDSREIIA